MSKVALNLIAIFLFSIHPLENLRAIPMENLTTEYTQKIIEEELVSTPDEKKLNGGLHNWPVFGDWPALHRFLIKRDFAKALQVLDIFPGEAAITVPKGSPEGYAYGARVGSLELAIRCDAPIEIIEKLILLGANVNHHREDQKLLVHGDRWHRYIVISTPLLSALIKGNDEVVQLLLNYGANPEQVVYEAEEDYIIGPRKITIRANWFNLDDLLRQ